MQVAGPVLGWVGARWRHAVTSACSQAAVIEGSLDADSASSVVLQEQDLLQHFLP